MAGKTKKQVNLIAQLSRVHPADLPKRLQVELAAAIAVSGDHYLEQSSPANVHFALAECIGEGYKDASTELQEWLKQEVLVYADERTQ